MVLRRLNKPVYKIGAFPVSWFREVGTSWFCRHCGKQQKPLTVAHEICVRYAGKGLTKQVLGENYEKAVKIFLCLDCSEKMHSEVLDCIRMCKSVGPQAYDLFTKV